MTEVQIPLNPDANLVISSRTAADDVVIAELRMPQQQEQRHGQKDHSGTEVTDGPQQRPGAAVDLIVGGCSESGELLIVGSEGWQAGEKVIAEFRSAAVVMTREKTAVTKPDYDEPQNVVSDAIGTAQIELAKAADEGHDEKVLTSEEAPCVLKVHQALGLNDGPISSEAGTVEERSETTTVLKKGDQGNGTMISTAEKKIAISSTGEAVERSLKAAVSPKTEQKLATSPEQPWPEMTTTATTAEKRASPEPAGPAPPLIDLAEQPKEAAEPEAHEGEGKNEEPGQQQQAVVAAGETNVVEQVLSQTEASLIELGPVATVATPAKQQHEKEKEKTAEAEADFLHEGEQQRSGDESASKEAEINAEACRVDASCNQTLIAEAPEPSAIPHAHKDDHQEAEVQRRQAAATTGHEDASGTKAATDLKSDSDKTPMATANAQPATGDQTATEDRPEVTAGNAVGGFGDSIPMIDDGPAAAEAKAAAEAAKTAAQKEKKSAEQPAGTTAAGGGDVGEGGQTDSLTRGQRLRNRVKQLCTVI